MIRIAVVDDENAICGNMETIITQFSKDYYTEIETEVYFSGKELCSALKQKSFFDLIFLDIEMDYGDGIEVGKYIRNEMQDDSTQIVFVSGKTEYDRQLFEFHPLGFIDKPVSDEKLYHMLNKYLKIYGDLNEIFSYKSEYSNHWVKIKDIMYFESRDRKILIIDNERKIHEFYGKLDNIYEQVKAKGFMMIHKSYIINYRFVCEFHSNEILMADGNSLSISKHRKKDVMKWQLLMEKGGKVKND